jgi:methanogenic corrinoid protein MtbC1
VIDAMRSTARLLELASAGRPRPAITFGLGLLADGTSLEEVILEVLAPVQREVGALWEANRWSVADEHAATAVVDGVLGALSLETALAGPRRGEVLVACAEGEHHTLPARMGAEILRAEGWEVTFLGGSLPADELQRFAAEREPDVVVVSCTVPLFLSGAGRCFTAVGEIGLPALAVGAGFGADARRARRLGARGWLGPGMDLAMVLAHCSEPEPWSTPPEAIALELECEALQGSCLTMMMERMPVMATYTPAQLASTGTDLAYILGFLRTAVELDDDEIFGMFVTWRSGLLSSRGVPPAVLDASLQIIGDVLESVGMPHGARLCEANSGAATQR